MGTTEFEEIASILSKKVVIITQARIGSTRFPRKILQEVSGKSLLELHLMRLKQSVTADTVIVATTEESGVESILRIAEKMNVDAYQGSLDDVLDRFYQAALPHAPDYVVRVTSDCPLIDGDLLDKVVNYAVTENLDYCSNILVEDYPDGQDIEVFTFAALKAAWEQASEQADREHVTPYIRRNSTFNGRDQFRSANFSSEYEYGHVRMTVDEAPDFACIQTLVEELGAERDWMDYTNFILEHADKFQNQRIIRNEGSKDQLI